MIQLYSGTPGSGKSLHVCHEIRRNLLYNKRVISTMYVEPDMVFWNAFDRWRFNSFGKEPKKKKHDRREENFTYIDIMDITPEFLYEYAARYHVHGREHQTIVYLDECVAIFSPTVLADNVKLWNRWDDFFRKHRHLGFDLVLIPQSAKLISRKVIEYCEFDVRHFNRKHHGNFGFFLSLFIGGLFSYSVCWRGIKAKPLEQGWFTYKPYYGNMYNSYCMFDSTLLPYKKEWEKKKILYAKLAGSLIQYGEKKQELYSGLAAQLLAVKQLKEAEEVKS